MSRSYAKFFGWVLAIIAAIWLISPPPLKVRTINYLLATAALCLGIRMIWKGDD
jgi:hypothetical protein